MRAEILLPDGTPARLAEDGEWSCARPAWLSLLRGLAEETPMQSYLPDPAAARLAAAVAETGARIVSEQIPAAEASAPGAIH